jgi:predicted RNA binding protein YcfA (HicA-like mRNA interferase family)
VSAWPSSRARIVYKALLSIGWKPVSQKGSHIKLRHGLFPEYMWAFHDGEEIGPKMLVICKVALVQSSLSRHNKSEAGPKRAGPMWSAAANAVPPKDAARAPGR